MDGNLSAYRPEVSHRRMLTLALPMTLSHVTTPLLGLVDATVIGRLGEAHLLGAVALGAAGGLSAGLEMQVAAVEDLAEAADLEGALLA